MPFVLHPCFAFFEWSAWIHKTKAFAGACIHYLITTKCCSSSSTISSLENSSAYVRAKTLVCLLFSDLVLKRIFNAASLLQAKKVHYL